jgi:hypothetical protein
MRRVPIIDGAAFWLQKQVHHRRWQVYGRNPMDKTLIRRRDLLLAVTVSGAAAAAASMGAASTQSPTELRRDKRKPQYQANSPEVQTFYRVNRYPVK